MSVKKAPDCLTFHKVVLERSPQFRQIHKDVEKFMDKYLTGVEKEVSNAKYF